MLSWCGEKARACRCRVIVSASRSQAIQPTTARMSPSSRNALHIAAFQGPGRATGDELRVYTLMVRMLAMIVASAILAIAFVEVTRHQ